MLYLLAGFLIGTLAEYFIHRLIGHGPGAARSRSNLVSHHAMFHHRVFTARRGYTAERGSTRREHVHLQLSAAFVLAALAFVPAIGAALFELAAPVAEAATGGQLLAIGLWGGGGLILAIVAYDVLHWMHHAELPEWLANLPGYKQARGWHHAHHADPTSCYGVVLPLWDIIFRTHVGLEDHTSKLGDETVEEEAPRSRSGNRKRPTTTVQAMLDQAMADAEADLDDDGKTKAKKTQRKKRPTTGMNAVPTDKKKASRTGPHEKKPVAEGEDREGARTRPKTRPGGRIQITTSGKAKKRPAQNSTAQWLASLDADASKNLDIQITAVAVDDE